MLLVPSDHKYFDSAACLPELVPKLTVGLPPGMERASVGHGGIYVDEDSPVTLDGDWHLDVETPGLYTDDLTRANTSPTRCTFSTSLGQISFVRKYE